MIPPKNDFVVIGDTHFFDKNFNLEYFENQMLFYETQLFPYMEENNIKYLLQTGDLFDNRTTINIHLFNLFIDRFCRALVSKGFTLITFLGNHDIVFKNTLEFNMVKYLQELFPSNIRVIQEDSIIGINDYNVGIVPWVTPNRSIDPILLETTQYIFGHFELYGYMHSKNAIDDKSEMKADIFKNQIKVFSGHYHLNHAKGKVHYVGTPYQADFGEFGNNVGFYHFKDDFSYKFCPNTVSTKYIKMYYDDSNVENPLKMYTDDETFVYVTLDTLKDTKGIEVRFTIDRAQDASYEEYLLVLKENNIKYTFINNQELNALINSSEVLDTSKLKTTEHFIIGYIEEYNKDLLDLTKQILKEVQDA